MYLRIVLFLLLLSCKSVSQVANRNPTALVEEIRAVEKQFETDLNTLGAGPAFEKYAAPNAVLKRGDDSLIRGPQAIRTYYSGPGYQNAKAYWSPEQIDVSPDGNMAATYGRYRWLIPDKNGKTQEYTGVFHTVWKRQANGSWKYIWD